VLRQDLIQRLIEKMAAFLARVAGQGVTGRVDEVDAELRAIERDLELPRGYEALDARSMALLLGRGDKLALLALVSWHRGEVAAERGNVVEAARQQRMARDLLGDVSRAELSAGMLELCDSHPIRGAEREPG
jgi:hypothetical protein